MSTLSIVVGILLLVLALFLIVAVLMQQGKSHNLSGAIAGGAETFFGKSKAQSMNKKLSLVTSIVAVVFVVVVLVLTIIQTPNEKMSFATVDDDFFKPDYHVALVNGVMIQFENDGRLEKIEVRNGDIPDGIIPIQIVEAVKGYYPDARIIEYEVGKRSYEVKLSNRLELKFNTRFEVIELE